MQKSKATRRRSLPSGSRSAVSPGPLSSIVLTAEEEALFTPEFLRDSIARAMIAVQTLERDSTQRINGLLAMRDLLFAKWLRENTSGVAPDMKSGQHQPLETLVPERASVYQRVNRFAESRNLAVQDYLRFVDAFEQLNQPISEDTSDEELGNLFELVGAKTK